MLKATGQNCVYRQSIYMEPSLNETPEYRMHLLKTKRFSPLVVVTFTGALF